MYKKIIHTTNVLHLFVNGHLTVRQLSLSSQAPVPFSCNQTLVNNTTSKFQYINVQYNCILLTHSCMKNVFFYDPVVQSKQNSVDIELRH